jgi:hypothetical protein
VFGQRRLQVLFGDESRLNETLTDLFTHSSPISGKCDLGLNQFRPIWVFAVVELMAGREPGVIAGAVGKLRL